MCLSRPDAEVIHSSVVVITLNVPEQLHLARFPLRLSTLDAPHVSPLARTHATLLSLKRFGEIHHSPVTRRDMWAFLIAVVLGAAAIVTASIHFPIIAIPAAGLSALLLILWAFYNENGA